MREKRINLVWVLGLVVALFGTAVPLGGAAPVVTAYPGVGYTTAILPDGHLLWVGTQGGELVRVDLLSGQEQRFHFPSPGVPVRKLARDSRGRIWVATGGGGLGRFDGQTWVTFTPENSSFPSSDVRTVLVDEAERVWAGTAAGIARLDGDTWTVYDSRTSGLASDDVSALVVGYQVWCGSNNGLSVLSRGPWNTEEWSVFQTTNSGLPHDRITALALDKLGRLWVGTETGVAWTRDGSEWWTDSAIDGPVSDILVGGDRSLWFNLGGRVGHYTPCRWFTYDGNVIGLKATSLAAIALDAWGQLWAGGEGGVAMLAPSGVQGDWTATEIEQPVHAITALGNDLWLAAGGAAVRYSPLTGEQFFTLPEYGLGSPVRSIAVDEPGRVWFATWGHGLTVFDGNGWEVYTTENSPLPSNFVSVVLPVPGGGLLFGTSAGVASHEDGDWHTFGAAELGFPHAQITAAAVAPDGHIAVSASGSGVSVYDGRQWTVYNTLNSNIPSDYIQTMTFDGLGVLWLGTQGSGVARWDGEQWTNYPAGPAGPAGNFVRALAVSPDGTLWVGVEDGGLSRFDGCNWTVYEPPLDSVAVAGVYALSVDGGSRIWLGTERGLIAFVPPTPYPFVVPPPAERLLQASAVPSAPGEPAVAVAADPTSDQWITHGVARSVHHIAFADDVIWVSTRFGGAVRWNTTGEFTRFLFPQDGIGGNEVVYTAIDPLGRVWCATLERGVSVYDGAKWVVYNTENSGLSHNNVNGIAFGKSGEIWFATLGGGVSMFDGKDWAVFDKENSGIAGDYVWYVDIDPEGRLWCGCMEGLSVYADQTWYTYPNTSNVHCVAFDSQGRTWFGDGMGLNLVDGTGVVEVSREQFNAYTRDVYAIAFDATDTAWLGTASGIYKYTGENLIHYSAEVTGLAGRQVFAASVGSDGRVWFGTDAADGITSFDGTFWTRYTTASGPNPVGTDVVASYVDSLGRVWLGTDRGVSVYDGETWVGYTPENSGLAARRVQAIAQDPSGRMWFGTPQGISVFDGETWSHLLPIADATGLADESVEAIVFDAAGRAWVGCSVGVSVFADGVWRTFTPENSGLANEDITSLAIDHQGRIWAGSWQLGDLSVFDGTRWETISREQYGLNAWWVKTISVDVRGSVWIGTDAGFSVFDGVQWSAYTPDVLDEDFYSVSSLVFDPGGGTWIGYYGGVTRLDASGWVHYTPGNSPLVSENVLTLAVDPAGHVWIGAAEGGASELIPGETRFKMPATPTPVPTWTPYLLPATDTPTPVPATDTPTPKPVQTATPFPAPASQATGLEPAGSFADFWLETGGENGPLGWTAASERQLFCADQRFEHGYMFWRNQEPEQGVIYVLMNDDGIENAGTWQGVADTWDETQPIDSGLIAPPDRYAPGRGFGKVWRAMLDGDTPPPAIGWALETEQGLEEARYQDFVGATLLFSPRLNQIFVLHSDGRWRAVVP